MTLTTQNILIFSIIIVLASAEITLNTQQDGENVKFSIFSDESLVVIGFEGQQEVRDYLFCRLQDCTCEDMISRGARSHPKLNSVQFTSNIQCQDQSTMNFERIDNGFKPYVWNNMKTEQEEKPMNQKPQQRITQTTTSTSDSTTAFTDSDMTASVTVGNLVVLKWKFNTDDTFDMCVIMPKKAWVGIGFGAGMKGGVDMFAININDNVPKIIDLWSTSEDTPPTDETNNYSLISYSITDNGLSVRLQRKLNTGDAKDKALTKGSSYTWSYASSTSLVMEDHLNDVKEFSVNFNESGSQSTSNSYVISVIMSLLMIALMF